MDSIKVTVRTESIIGSLESKSEVNVSIADQANLVGYEIPSWLSNSFTASKVGMSIISAYQDAQYRAEVLKSLKAIYEKLGVIESRIEDLHDKIDLLFAEIEDIKQMITDVPDEILLQETNSFVTRWKMGEIWTDAEYLDLFSKFYDQFWDLIDPPRTGWLSLNFAKTTEILTCCLSGLSRYCYLLIQSNDNDVSDSILNQSAEEAFNNKRDAILQMYRQLEIGYKKNTNITLHNFIDEWNEGNTSDTSFGLAESDRVIKAGWERYRKGYPLRAILEDGEFLRKLNLIDLRWYFSNYYVPKDDTAEFRAYHYLKFNTQSGCFDEKAPMILFPERSVKLVNSGRYKNNQRFDLIGKQEYPISAWSDNFKFEIARSQNPKFKKRTRRHKTKMTTQLKKINDSWKTYLLLSINEPLVSETLEAIRTARYWPRHD